MRRTSLDPTDAVARFALDLDALRGGVSYANLAARVNSSATTLLKVTRGQRLPRKNHLELFVRACGGSVEEWTRRWEVLNIELTNKAILKSVGWERLRAVGELSTPEDLQNGLYVLIRQKGLTIREVSRLANYAMSSVSAAVRGHDFPTLALLKAIVGVCQGDLSAWLEAWVRVQVPQAMQNKPNVESPLAATPGEGVDFNRLISEELARQGLPLGTPVTLTITVELGLSSSE